MSPTDRSDRPRPAELWQQADDEFPNDQAGRRIRYIALMREHGYLRPTLPGDDRNLSCGWHGRRVTNA